ncbi:MAG: hypothetical protein ACHQ17_02075, partial [Polyangia bacterium]
MAEGAVPPPSASSRRGPPPLPRGAIETPPPMTTVSDSPLDELLELIAAEAQAADNKRRGADLRARAALLTWDRHGDVQQALAFLEKVDHPLAWSIRLAAALESGPEQQDKLLNACVADAKRRGDKHDLADLGGLLLWRPRDAQPAAELLRHAGEDRLGARRLALSIAGGWSELVETLVESKGGKDGDAEVLAEAAGAAQDRLSDPKLARELLLRAFDRAGRAPHSPYVIERLLEVSETSDAGGAKESADAGQKRMPVPIDVYRARLLALGPADDGRHGTERAATMYLLAVAFERAGAETEAAAQIGHLCDEPEPTGYGPLLAWRARTRLEAVRGEWARAAEAWEKLAALSDAAGTSVEWTRAYLRRAAEVWDARVGDPARAEVLYG